MQPRCTRTFLASRLRETQTKTLTTDAVSEPRLQESVSCEWKRGRT